MNWFEATVVLVPTYVSPFPDTKNGLVVACGPLGVEEPIANIGVFGAYVDAPTDRRPHGVDVPTPRSVPVVRYVDAPELVKKFEPAPPQPEPEPDTSPEEFT